MPFLKHTRVPQTSAKLNSILNYRPALTINSPGTDLGGYLSSTPRVETGRVVTHIRDAAFGVYALAICLVNFITQIRNHALYHFFQTCTSLFQTILSIPRHSQLALGTVQDTVSTLSFTDTRELWWLERRLDARLARKFALRTATLVSGIASKFYLSFVIGLTLLMLNSGAGFLSTTSSSQVSQFFTDRLNLPTQNEPNLFRGASTINAAAFSLSEQAPIVSILSHTVVEGDTLESLSNLYSITTDTIRFNNDVEEPLEIGSIVYLPWIDGYIYRAADPITAQAIADIYSVDAASIRTENRAILDTTNDQFAADSLVLIPTTDFAKITETNQAIEAARAEAEAEAAEQARQAALARQSISTVQDYTPVVPASGGFIWPTSGIISRCLQPGHVACDIANVSGPSVVAAQSGTVVQVYNFDVIGYGKGARIDHGNGLQTIYAHFSDTYVVAGQQVAQGTALGRMGCTGFCTGTHLHFEVIQSGVKQNPLAYLP